MDTINQMLPLDTWQLFSAQSTVNEGTQRYSIVRQVALGTICTAVCAIFFALLPFIVATLASSLLLGMCVMEICEKCCEGGREDKGTDVGAPTRTYPHSSRSPQYPPHPHFPSSRVPDYRPGQRAGLHHGGTFGRPGPFDQRSPHTWHRAGSKPTPGVPYGTSPSGELVSRHRRTSSEGGRRLSERAGTVSHVGVGAPTLTRSGSDRPKLRAGESGIPGGVLRT